MEVDKQAALYWYLKSSLHGHARSLKFVSEYYISGIEPLKKDVSKAVAWQYLAKARGYEGYLILPKLIKELDEESLNRARDMYTEIKNKINSGRYEYSELVDEFVPKHSCEKQIDS